MSNPKYNTDSENINWDAVEEETVRKFRYLRHFLKATPEPLRAKVMEDLIVPNVSLLAEFCANIEEECPTTERGWISRKEANKIMGDNSPRRTRT